MQKICLRIQRKIERNGQINKKNQRTACQTVAYVEKNCWRFTDRDKRLPKVHFFSAESNVSVFINMGFFPLNLQTDGSVICRSVTFTWIKFKHIQCWYCIPIHHYMLTHGSFRIQIVFSVYLADNSTVRSLLSINELLKKQESDSCSQ